MLQATPQFRDSLLLTLSLSPLMGSLTDHFPSSSDPEVKNARMVVKFKTLAGGDGKEVHLVIEGDLLARKGAKITHVDAGKTLALIEGAKWKLSEKILVNQLVLGFSLCRSS